MHSWMENWKFPHRITDTQIIANLSAWHFDYLFTLFTHYIISSCNLDAVCIIINITGEPTKFACCILPKVLQCVLHPYSASAHNYSAKRNFGENNIDPSKNTLSSTGTGGESNINTQAPPSIQIPTHFHKSITFTDEVIRFPKWKACIHEIADTITINIALYHIL